MMPIRDFQKMKTVEGNSISGKHFIERASWTLVDQCVASGGNFLLMVLLARSLSEEDYGEFGLFLGAIYLMRTIDYSFISYPLSVRLCVANDEERARLLGNTVALTVALSFVRSCSWRLEPRYGRKTIFCCRHVFATCAGRRKRHRGDFLLAHFRYREAVHGDGVAYVGQVLLIAVLLWIDTITLLSSLYAMSATFAAGALVHASKVRFARPDFAEMRVTALEYLSVGKWSVLNYQLVFVRVQLFSWLLAAIAGIAATASFQAGLNIANMMNPIIFGIGNAIMQIADATSWRRSRRVTSGIWLCALRVGPDSGHLRRRSADAGSDLRTVYGPSSPYLAVATGLQLLVVAGVHDNRRNHEHDTAQVMRLPFPWIRGRRRGAGIGAHRPAGRVRCVPRPVDCQSDARHRRGDRDRVANR